MGQPYPGLLNHKHHPWTKAMRDCEDEFIVGQKAAQLGFTEVALDKCFYAIDIKGLSVMYVLPASNPDASDFSTSRFDPALELSPHLEHLFSEVKNIGHKRAGSANLYLRGSRSRSQLKSVPVGLLILDEMLDVCDGFQGWKHRYARFFALRAYELVSEFEDNTGSFTFREAPLTLRQVIQSDA